MVFVRGVRSLLPTDHLVDVVGVHRGVGPHLYSQPGGHEPMKLGSKALVQGQARGLILTYYINQKSFEMFPNFSHFKLVVYLSSQLLNTHNTVYKGLGKICLDVSLKVFSNMPRLNLQVSNNIVSN